jgi:hypothetical protein
MILSTRDSISVPWNLQIARITLGNQARAVKFNTQEFLARIAIEQRHREDSKPNMQDSASIWLGNMHRTAHHQDKQEVSQLLGRLEQYRS